MGIYGNQKVLIDDKDRLTIPTKFRKSLPNDLVISFEFEGNLVIRGKKDFEIWANILISKGNLNKNARKLQRYILGNSIEVKIDPKGRILIPKSLIEVTNFEDSVYIVGIGNKIEIISSLKWQEIIDNKEDENNLSIEQAAELLENI